MGVLSLVLVVLAVIVVADSLRVLLRPRVTGAVAAALVIAFGLSAALARDDFVGGDGTALRAGGEPNLMVVGETRVVPPGPEGAEIEVDGDAVYLLDGKLLAVRAGRAVVTRGEEKFGIEVQELEALPLLTVADVAKEPVPLAGRRVRLRGTCRAWGPPAKAEEVVGVRATKSDWILEDETGALLVGGPLFRDPEEVTVVGTVVLPARDGFAFVASLVIAHRVDLSPKEENVLRVGQKCWLPLDFSKSTWSEFTIEGTAVKLLGQKDREDAFLEAAEEGEAVIKVWSHFFLDEEPAGPGEPKPPTHVYRVKVVRP